MMRFSVPVLCIFSAEILLCQQPALRPSALEAYLQQPNVQVTWSLEIGRFDSAEAHVTVTAILAQLSPAQKVTGVRVELENRNGIDNVYLSEEQIPALIDSLTNLDSVVEEFHNKRSTPPLYMGSCALRQSQPPFIHTLSASYYIAPDSSGLSLSSYNRQSYRFPDRRPADLASLLTKALGELKTKISA
jgi:hypothetical protein